MRAIAAVGVLVLASSSGAQPLVVQSPYPTGRNLGGAAFLSPDHGFLAGDNHHLIETTNGGQTWVNRIATPLSTDPFYKIVFSSPQTGMVFGNNQDGYRTINGGATWTPMLSTPFGSTNGVTAVSANDVYLGLNGAGAWTHDAGQTWAVSSGYPDHPIVFGIDFRDTLVGLAGGIRSTPYHDGGVYRTADGGVTWTLVHEGSINHVLWIGPNSALAIDGASMIRSDDDGVTWYSYGFSLIDTGFAEFTRVGNTDALAGVSLSGDIWSSMDLGLSWFRVVEGIGVLPAQWSVHFSDDLHGWVVGANGLTYRTVNGGASWDLMNSGCGDEITDVRFFDDSRGMAVTHNGFVFITSNGGQRWEVQRLRVTGLIFGRSEGLQTVWPAAPGAWLTGGLGGVLFRTDDDGESWVSLGYPSAPWGDSDVTSIRFTDTLNGWVGTNGAGDTTLWRTADGGYSWESTSGVIGSIAGIDAAGQRAWAAYASNIVMRTINGGQTWSPVTIPDGATGWYYASEVDFADENTGWVVGWYGGIARSTNGGASWTPQMQPQNETFLDVVALSPTEAWTVGYDSGSFRHFYKRTINGGATWVRTELPGEESFSELAVRPSGRAWFAGSFGKILCKPAPPLTMSLPTGTPATAAPGERVSVDVVIAPGEEQIGSASLHVRANSTETYQEIPLQNIGGNSWRGELPQFRCADAPQFYLSATGSAGTVVRLPANAPSSVYTLRVGVFETAPVLDATFTGGLPAGWTATGLWHVSSVCPPPGVCGVGGERAYFGQDSTCTFNTGARVAGILRSPTIALPTLQSGQNLTLTFCSALDTEYPNGALGDDDQAQLWWVSGAQQAPLEWFTDHSSLSTRTFNLNTRAGQTGRLEWRFDSMNTYMNSFRGWHIDNVRLLAPVLVCNAMCDPDVNCDGVPDQGDVACIILAVAGDASCYCQPDPDFNADGVPDQGDVADLILVVAGAPCP